MMQNKRSDFLMKIINKLVFISYDQIDPICNPRFLAV